MSGILGALLGSFPVGAATAFESIATATGTGSSATITFSSIPSSYQHLQIRMILNGSHTSSSANGTWSIRANSDSGSNYAQHNLRGDGSAVTAGSNTDTGNTLLLNAYPFGSTYSNIFGAAIIDIHDYASTSKYKTFRAFAGNDVNGAGNVQLGSGLWMSTSAITSLTISVSSVVSLTTGSTFALYGIKGA